MQNMAVPHYFIIAPVKDLLDMDEVEKTPAYTISQNLINEDDHYPSGFYSYHRHYTSLQA